MKLKSYYNFLSENLKQDGQMIGDYFLSTKEYNEIWSLVEYVVDDIEDFDRYLSILDTYYNNGGKIQRVLFTNKVNTHNFGHHWTHLNNDIDNYIQDLYDFLYEEGKVGVNPNISIIYAETPSKNISINYALEQYRTNPWEQEIYVENVKLLSKTSTKIIK